MTTTITRPAPAADEPFDIAAALDQAAAAISLAYRTMLGLDGSTVDEAVDAAWTPTGPSREELHTRIIARRAEVFAGQVAA